MKKRRYLGFAETIIYAMFCYLGSASLVHAVENQSLLQASHNIGCIVIISRKITDFIIY